MKCSIFILACLATLVLSAPYPEGDVEEAAVAATAGVDAEEAAVESNGDIQKRTVCDQSAMHRVASCFYGIPQRLFNKGIYGTGVCNVRSNLQTEFVSCANQEGCGNDSRIDFAIKQGMKAYDNSVRQLGGDPSKC